MNAIICTIGTEITRGQILNTNAQYCAQKLTETGIIVSSINSIRDIPAEMIETIQYAYAHHSVTILCGGLGPTDDDITRAAVAAALNRPLQYMPKLERNIASFFKSIRKPMSDANKQQAYIPHGMLAIDNKNGTAPGFYLGHDNKLLAVMPGVPREMQGMMEEKVIPLIRRMVKKSKKTEILVIKTTGIGESMLASKLIRPTKELHALGITLAYKASADGVQLILSGESSHRSLIKAKLQKAKDSINKAISAHIYGYNDTTLSSAVGKLLIQKKVMLVTAESCTGGMLGEQLTAVSGASRFYHGGWITYSNTQKRNELQVKPHILKKYGAVSKQTVRAMAAGAQKESGAEYAVAVSGIAGPDGGTQSKPVGLVFIGIAYPDHTVSTHRYIFPGNRAMIRKRTCTTALWLLYQHLKRNNA